MLKNFILPRKDGHGSKGRITSADISTPTKSPDGANIVKHMKTVPIRNASEPAMGASARKVSPSKSRSSSRLSHSKDLNSPEKVIKALQKYRATSAKEMSFDEGEFFYVAYENDKWFEASNPSTGKRGLVPRSHFEVFDKTRHSLNSSTPIVPYGGHPLSSDRRPLSSRSTDMEGNKMGSLYAIVLYDFKAEKSDELTSYVGENLFICAHHNFEWFIAKPIGRLGGPGLVPVGFVSIIDIGTGYATGNDVMEDIKSVNLPTIQEWKANVAKYKASNIALGQIGYEHDYYNEPSLNENDEDEELRRREQQTELRTSTKPFQVKNPSERGDRVIDASVDFFDLEDEKYWFAVTCELSSGKTRKLKRYYQDFYDLQVQLLDNFPSESGKLRDKTGQWTKRIIPFIPGPVPYVTDTITKKRKEDLNVYIKELIRLPPYIAGFVTVRKLFMLRKNGYDHEEAATEKVPEKIDTRMSKDGTTAVIGDFRKGSGVDGGSVQDGSNADNTLTKEDLGNLYDKTSKLSISPPLTDRSRQPSAPLATSKPTKIKFYYNNDIFALMLNNDVTFNELRDKIAPRVDGIKFKLHVKLAEGDAEEITTDAQVSQIIQAKLKISVHDVE
ncbi:phosphatidylinositol-3-phosphate-binding protein BEM1 KNAG_0A03720 [Huiozyma naganishii CBS 8797]|uniref:Bud emergence protein 1 n=1 Tax=Huiozyma naganishii (strain ATCC MYA-139 / BCRC 22969 / CBS 8797 / KCTC 17520 / NBRC 10181 / NCYC 3082 / Yp74L-3) TaxID=1071383 RepID=J7RTJ3_HUIN7|nr:hypothetical protein KNAG_0A03720 [Kazachstania naganishii CBS 8797]CCK68052.1 hypothetical protein KNAG_0A03720 [Kazachstania naganishii CBS 8797]